MGEYNNDPRPVVKWFAEHMEGVLAMPKNEAKTHWSTMTNDALLFRAVEELGELAAAHREGAPGLLKLKEAIDVANFMMMYADNLNRGKG